MPIATITPDLEMHYEVDDFAEPWRERDTVLLMHGNAEINRITQLFDVKAKLDDLGTRLKPMTPEKFTEFLHAEIAKYQKVAKETGVRME